MINTWWQSLDFTLQIFYGLGIASTALLAIQMVMILLGLGGDADLDLDVDHDGGGVLSVNSVSAFFTGFAWSGIAALQADWPTSAALVVATAVGTLFMFGVYFLMRGLHSLRASGTLDYQNAVGALGSVYLPVAGRMEKPGQVEVVVQGRLCVVRAMTRADTTLANRTRIRVTEYLGSNTLLVEPVSSAVPSTSGDLE